MSMVGHWLGQEFALGDGQLERTGADEGLIDCLITANGYRLAIATGRCLVGLNMRTWCAMTEQDLGNVAIVLVEPTHPGNIGAAARAMKTMGLTNLVLVNPKQFPCAEATARASGADDVLFTARICATLTDALANCSWAVAASARPRRVAWPMLDPADCAREVLRQSARAEAAIVFGRENSGLSNAEIDKCQAQVRIPTREDFSSLNIAASVQILCYELRRVVLHAHKAPPPDRFEVDDTETLVSVEELEGFYDHLAQILIRTEFLDPASPKKLMRRLRRLFGRAGVRKSEVNILRGILNSVQRKIG